MKLSNRLQLLLGMIADQYEQIWDCCCDHGYLGQAILNTRPKAQVHFLDVVPSITTQLEQKLRQSEFSQDRWAVHCGDIQQFVLPKSDSCLGAQGRKLLVIAGVGGDLTLDMVSAVLHNNPDSDIDFLICPVRQLYKVRSGVQKLGLGLVNEAIVKDSGRYYEAIHISTLSQKEVHVVGESMWDLTQEGHQEYLRQNISHYKRMQAQGSESVRKILAEYMKLQELPA
ncbi:tRNA (adenine(22)-N(1))-methyltransferase TrmK [Neptuniibacter sp. QD29_5]|uniref:tRNA (adenine(22)-N(1))-methyltransferase TrmK n=1 Tax=Neptuniibacter sp. QD29_5 TaxID=3398207 RepID=UPI0039F46DC8